MRNKRKINPLKWIGYLFSPIQKNGAFFVFMFALGWICTHLEIMPYYLRNKGAEPYELTVPELFLDIYIVCALLMLIPKKIRIWVKALLYVFLYGLALVDMFCYERFESTLTPTMLMLAMETTSQELGHRQDKRGLDSIADGCSCRLDFCQASRKKNEQADTSTQASRVSLYYSETADWTAHSLVPL